MSLAERIDHAISVIAPIYGSRRMRARAQVDAIRAATMLYDGAARSFRTESRRIAPSSANSEIVLSLGRLRDVHRDLVRNNAYAANVVHAIQANIVGAGIVPRVVTERKRLKKEIARYFLDHLETPAIDFDGRHNLYGLQSLVARTVAEAGEALIVRYDTKKSMSLPLPMQVRVLEPDYLDPSVDGILPNGHHAFQGIEFDADGRRVAYHLFREHPGNQTNWRFPDSARIEADRVRHIYRVDRPGQMRGVPWGAPVIMTMWDLNDYEGAELVRQKIAACFAVFFENGAGQNLAQEISSEKTRAGHKTERLEPGMIQNLPAGVKPHFATPPTLSGYSEYIRASARKVACGYGVPYEIATGDLSQVSFISGRLGRLNFNLSVDQWRWHIHIPHACAPIAQWTMRAIGIESGAGMSGVRVDWTPPRREMVEPSKEIPAIRDAIRSGLSSLSEELRTLGFDPQSVMQEIASDNETLDALKLILDSDGRKPIKGSAANQGQGNDASQSAD